MTARRLVAALLVTVAVRAEAQDRRAPSDAPRFLHASAEGTRDSVEISAADEPVLNRRIAIRVSGVTRVAALAEVALAAGVQFVHAADVLARYGPEAGDLSIQSDNITLAAVLTRILRGAGVDVAVGPNATLVIVKKPRPKEARVDTVAVDVPDVSVSRGYSLAPVVTLAPAESRLAFESQPTMGQIELGAKELSAAPSLFEGDVLRTIQLLPGVETRNDWSSALSVRGGEPDQNLILLDGYPVYNPFHLGGLLGTFMDPMVGKVDLLTGAEPLKYGERLSSVLDVKSAEENRRGLHGTADVSLLATTLSVGSAFSDGGSWMIGGRHTYADVIANAIRPNSLPYGFSDLQGHLVRPVFGGAVLSVTGYVGADGTSISQNTGGLNASWGNKVLGATLSHTIAERKRVLGFLAADSIALVQRASFTTFSAGAVMATRNFDLQSNVRDVRASGAVTLFGGAVDQSVGYEVSSERVRYAMQAPTTSITNFLPQAALDQTVTPVSGWYDALWRVTPRFLIDGGVRVDAVGGTGWTGASPRASAKYFLTKDLAIVGATGSYTQWLHSLGQEDAPAQPLEFWIASNGALPVSRAWQSSLGVEAWTSPRRQLRVEGFYKKYSNLVEANAAADPSTGDAPFIELGGTSYGADVLIRQLDTGKFGGWIAYTYAVSDRVLPDGEHFSPGQDRRHVLNAVGTWRRGRYHMSARFEVSTGAPYTPILGEFTRERYDPVGNTYAPDAGGGDSQYISGPANSARMPIQNRLDVSIARVGTGTRTQVTPYLTIANVYGAPNTAFYIYDYAHQQTVGGVLVPAPQRMSFPNLPFLPTIGVHIAY
ncbi:MAG TPA: TonB-dependent receptor plug domain-containing protein [Gemmatimonadaceae bacterium]